MQKHARFSCQSSSKSSRKQFNEIPDIHVFKISDRILNSIDRFALAPLSSQSLELLARPPPAHRPRVKAFVVTLFDRMNGRIPKSDLEATGHLVRKSSRQRGIGSDPHASQKLLNIARLDSFDPVLLWIKLAVEKRDRHHILKAMIGVFFGVDLDLGPFFAAPDDVVSCLEGVDFYRLDIFAFEMISATKLERAFDCRLRMNLRIKLFND